MTTKTSFYIGLTTQNGETIKPENIIDSIKQVVDAGTFKEAKGLWKGETENTLIFECVNLSEHSELGARELADSLAEEFNQESVMTEESRVKAAF